MYQRCMVYDGFCIYIVFTICYKLSRVLVFCVAEEKNIDIFATYACTYTDAVSDSTCRMHIMYTVGGTKTVTSLYPSTILVQEHLRSWKPCFSPSSIP